MGAVEDTRKAVQDFLAPELRTLAAHMEALAKEQNLLRSELRNEMSAVEGRTRAEILASEARLIQAIDRMRSDLPLLVRNAVLEQLLLEKERIIEDYQRQRSNVTQQ